MAFEIHEHAFSDCMQIGAEVAWLAACHTESFRDRRDRPHARSAAHSQRAGPVVCPRTNSQGISKRLPCDVGSRFDVGREAEATAAAADN